MLLHSVASSAKFKPDVCMKGPLDWNPIASAGSFSAFCGIMAGFVFAGVVMIIGQKNATGGDGHASRGLRLLLPSFFGLAVASYLYSVISGELVCKRALVEQLFAGGVLAANAAVVITALAWLLLAYERNTHGEVSFLRGLIAVAAVFVMLMLATSSVGFHNAWTARKAAGWADWMVWGTLIGFALIAAFIWLKPVPATPPGEPPEWPYATYLNKRVNLSAWINLLASAALAGFSAFFVGTPYDELNLHRGTIYAMSEAAFVIPALIVISAVMAAPRR